MFNNLLKKVKNIFKSNKKDKATKVESLTKPSIVNPNNSVSKLKVISNDNKRPMICQNCEEELGSDSINSARSDDGSYYYSRCSCGFVNKIVGNKAYVPDLLEIRNAFKLFKNNGINFEFYSTTQNGEKKAL